MATIKLFHGSSVVVEKPLFACGKPYNDYGQGFYCTEYIDLGKEWACATKNGGFINEYEFDLTGLKVLNLSDEKYSILNWLALLMNYRIVNLKNPFQEMACKYLIEHFLPDISGYDVIVGYRADDSYFLFARSFVNNEISLDQLARAMRLGKLGEQYCLKTEKAFSQIHFVKSEVVDAEKYYYLRIDREQKARDEYIDETKSFDIDGIYMRDIIREGMKNDDPRLR